MNKKVKNFWEDDPEWRDRLVIASRHRARAHLVETSAWTAFDPRLKPKHEMEWQLTLFAALASGMPDLAEEAIQNGARQESPLERTWLGAWRGEMLPTNSTEAAYYWVYPFKWQFLQDRVIIMTPIQAAMAGGCTECIAKIINAGANFQQAIDWLRPLLFDIPRIESALSVCEFIAERRAFSDYKPALATWIKDMDRWLRRALKRVREDRTERETIARIYRRLLRASQRVGFEIKPSSATLAELL